MISKEYVKDAQANPLSVLNTRQMDANESIFFVLELQHIQSKVIEVEYQELKARLIIPMNTEASNADETIAYYQFDKTGNAKVVVDYANDFPLVDVLGQKFVSNIRSLGDAFHYDIQEIRAAAKVNRPLTTMKANAAKRAARVLEDQIAWFGDPINGLGGFLTNPNIPVLSLPVGATGGQVAWSTKTPDEILKDMNLVVNTIHSNTLGVEKGTWLLLPSVSYNYIASTYRSQYSDKTILDGFMANNPYVEVVDLLFELEGAGPGGTTAMIAFDRNNMKVEMHLPQDFEMFPPQEKGLAFEVPCHLRTGGVTWYKPLAAMLAYGI